MTTSEQTAAERIAVGRFQQYRSVTDEDRRWAQRVGDALDQALGEDG